MGDEIRLVYFDIRGLAEPIRWMFKLAGIDFADERIPLDAYMTGRKRSSVEALKGDRRRSIEQKAGGRSKFVPQFPILFFGEDFVITQPLTVMRYVARKFGYIGCSELEEARADEVADLVYDLRLRAVDFEGTAFKSSTPEIVRHTVFRDISNEPDNPKKEKMKDDFRTMWFPLYFNKFDELLSQSEGEWIAGTELTYGDFVLANFLDIAEDLVDPRCLDEFPKLNELKKKVLALPEIAEWRKSQTMDKLGVDE